MGKEKKIMRAAGCSRKAICQWSALAAVILLTGVGVVFAFNIPGLGKSDKVKPVNGVVTIPAAKVSDGKAHFFRIVDGVKEIGFFVVKGADGALRTAFDACDVCFGDRKGYTQNGNFMVCRKCNKKFAIDRIGPHAVGGCNPSSLPHQESAGSVVITLNDLKTGARFF
jgi:uncharacterized membrane protein